MDLQLRMQFLVTALANFLKNKHETIFLFVSNDKLQH